MNNIYFFIGTKAQAIKCLPLLRKFIAEDICKVHIIDSGQHVEIVESIIDEFSQDVVRINLYENVVNISTFIQSFNKNRVITVPKNKIGLIQNIPNSNVKRIFKLELNISKIVSGKEFIVPK